MEYEWEQKAKRKIFRLIPSLQSQMPKGFDVFGIAVANHEAGEAAYWPIWPAAGIISADYAKDIRGDAQHAYDEAYSKIWGA